jgi:hypothetical protein|mmetsp:Transcript_22666/g.38780  ORF Transcript_22666/g.38780 Transcript_22666/m.38780 type:complete len:269 (-) Transcript_22666:793-1599(-)
MLQWCQYSERGKQGVSHPFIHHCHITAMALSLNGVLECSWLWHSFFAYLASISHTDQNGAQNCIQYDDIYYCVAGHLQSCLDVWIGWPTAWSQPQIYPCLVIRVPSHVLSMFTDNASSLCLPSLVPILLCAGSLLRVLLQSLYALLFLRLLCCSLHRLLTVYVRVFMGLGISAAFSCATCGSSSPDRWHCRLCFLHVLGPVCLYYRFLFGNFKMFHWVMNGLDKIGSLDFNTFFLWGCKDGTVLQEHGHCQDCRERTHRNVPRWTQRI